MFITARQYYKLENIAFMSFSSTVIQNSMQLQYYHCLSPSMSSSTLSFSLSDPRMYDRNKSTKKHNWFRGNVHFLQSKGAVRLNFA